MTTKQDVQRWFEGGLKDKNNTHLIVVCDTFDYDDYPVFVKSNENINEKIKHYSGNMQKIMEIYNLKMDMNNQLNQQRVYNV